MIGTDTISRVIGQDVYDESGEKIGSAAEVYLDDETGQPEWVTVRTGLFGTKESFVPIRDADLTDDGVRVPVSKDQVKDAPKIDTDGHLSPQEEQELYRYYGLGTRHGRHRHDRHDRRPPVTTADDRHRHHRRRARHRRPRHLRPDHGRRHDPVRGAPQRGHPAEEVGRARLRKYVVTENVTETVPVTREEVRVEREPITDANVGNALDGPAISEEEHEVVLHAEPPVVEKEAVPVERVRLDKETVTEQAEGQRGPPQGGDRGRGRRHQPRPRPRPAHLTRPAQAGMHRSGGGRSRTGLDRPPFCVSGAPRQRAPRGRTVRICSARPTAPSASCSTELVRPTPSGPNTTVVSRPTGPPTG